MVILVELKVGDFRVQFFIFFEVLLVQYGQVMGVVVIGYIGVHFKGQ